MDKPAVVDPICTPIGDLGLSQIILCFLIFLSKFPSGWIQISHIFLAYPMAASCATSSNITDICDEACKEHEFDRSVFEESIVSEFDLVCKREKLAPLSQTITMGGTMTGSIVFGILSDKFGRRPSFVASCLLLMIFSATVTFAPDFWVYCILKYIAATANGGVMMTSFVIIMEIIGKTHREMMAMLYHIPFNMGHMALPLLAYFFRNWREFNMSYSVEHFIFVIYICLIPESPRWLFIRGNIDKSASILTKMAKINGKPTETIRADLETAYSHLKPTTQAKKANIWDLFKTPYMRLKMIVMGFQWFVVCMSYYGISQYITYLGGNVFANVLIGASFGIFGTLISIPMTKYLGRKPTLIISNGLTAISLLCMAFLPSEWKMIAVVLTVVGLFGASLSFPTIYIYGGELVPTVVRNSGIGFCSFVGRTGAMLAPFVVDLNAISIILPGIVFGSISLVAALATFLLPETKKTNLPETLEDGENFGKKSAQES